MSINIDLYHQISKREFDARGGLANPKLFRKAAKNGTWRYYAHN